MSNKQLDVLLVTPAINMGGMQSAMAAMANGLVAQGVNVEMYAIFHLEHFQKLNQKICFSEPDEDTSKSRVLARIISIIRNVRKAAKQSRAGTIIVYGKFYSALTLLATLGLNKRVFISDRASPLYRDFWYVEFITRLIYFFIKPTGIIAQTKVSARYQQKRFGSKVPIRVIPNAIRPVKIYDYPKQNTVLAVGRFGDKLKGFDRLIEAWALVKAPGWKLKFAGGAEAEEPIFGQRAKELGIYDSIEFLGKVSNVDELYSASSIFVIPSRSEGFPNALAEAMTAGMCCIAFDFIAGAKDIITSGYDGLIVPDGDINALAHAIQTMINAPEQRIIFGRNAISSSTRFTRSKVCDSITDFIFSKI